MPVPPPIVLLLMLIMLPAVAWVASDMRRDRLHRTLSKLARENGMHYSSGDRLLLTPRVAVSLPVIGAAAVRVSNVLYRSGPHGHVYIFTAEYTAGIVRAKKRIRRVATFTEPRDRSHRQVPVIELAPPNGDAVSQYRTLLGQAGGPRDAVNPPPTPGPV